MGLIASSQLARVRRPLPCGGACGCLFAISFCFVFGGSFFALGQSSAMPDVSGSAGHASSISHTDRSRRFLGGRTPIGNVSAARSMDAARQQHAAMLAQQAASPQLSSLSTPWQPIGPNQVASIAYGNVTGRVTATAIDPADTTGNTVYLGTTGGGVWKSTNAAGPSASVTFTALTDTLPGFSANAGTPAIPSLSIRAISVHSCVVLP